MTAVQLNAMNTELWQSIGAIADTSFLCITPQQLSRIRKAVTFSEK